MKRADRAALAAVAALGLVALPNPFTGDQSLFAVGGRMMAHGAVYYRDMWDIKQPGIFLFYEVGGRIFGFSSVGLHLFELLWMLAFAAVLLATLPRWLPVPWVRAVGVVAAVGGYYIVTRPTSQTLIEPLVAFPLYVVMWASMRAVDDEHHRWRWFAAAGIAAGVVGVFKLIVVAVALWFLVTAVVRLRHGRLRACVVFAAGTAVVVAPFAVYYAAHHLSDLVWRTTFVYPPQVTRLGGMHTFGLLRDLLQRAVTSYGALIVLAIAVVVVRLRSRRLDAFTTNLIGWTVVGTAVVLAQKWNVYQAQLLLVPLALLSALAIDHLARQERTRATMVVAVVAGIGLLAPLALEARTGLRLAQNRFALSQSSRHEYQRSASSEFALIDDEVRSLGSLPGNDPIYVLGNPLYYVLLNRTQALAINGWSPEQWLDEQWRMFTSELAADPPRFLFVDHAAANLLEDRPDALAVIDTNYHSLWTSASTDDFAGTWYEVSAAR